MCSYGLHKFMSCFTHNILKVFQNKWILIRYPYDTIYTEEDCQQSGRLPRVLEETDLISFFFNMCNVSFLTSFLE